MEKALLEFNAFSHETKISIVAIFVLFLFMMFRFTPKTAAQGPTILTTAGILATFVGVAIGLSHFNAANIQSSVPELLNGLKTAFWASVAGVGGAIILKLREYWFGVSHGLSESNDDATAADIVIHLKQISQALVGNDDGSLISQLKLTRQDSNDRLDELKRLQKEALDQIAQMGSKVLIEALKEVIRDFNSKISEQFGDNFKQLNLAVGKLVEWQENYRVQVEEITTRLDATHKIIDKAAHQYSQLVANSETFTHAAGNLADLVRTVSDEKTRYAENSERLARALAAASGALPDIEGKILEITGQLTRAVNENSNIFKTAMGSAQDGVRDSTEQMSQAIADQANMLKTALQHSQNTMVSAAEEQAKTMTTTVQTTQREIAETSARMQEQLKLVVEKSSASIEAVMGGAQQHMMKSSEDVHKKLSASVLENTEALKKTLETAHSSIVSGSAEQNKHVDEMIRRTRDQVVALDKALSEELTKALNSLAGQLAALSNKFAADYTPLTEKLQRVVDIARKIEA